ncbi:MAG: hypothetical protein IPO18_08250 [bacterium]|nr:hypothetical protein [bacterium]
MDQLEGLVGVVLGKAALQPREVAHQLEVEIPRHAALGREAQPLRVAPVVGAVLLAAVAAETVVAVQVDLFAAEADLQPPVVADRQVGAARQLVGMARGAAGLQVQQAVGMQEVRAHQLEAERRALQFTSGDRRHDERTEGTGQPGVVGLELEQVQLVERGHRLVAGQERQPERQAHDPVRHHHGRFPGRSLAMKEDGGGRVGGNGSRAPGPGFMAVADAVGGSRAVVDLATGGNGISERDEEGCENNDSPDAIHDFHVADREVHGKLSLACGHSAVNRQRFSDRQRPGDPESQR